MDQKEKTIVFCATQLHALAVRDLINQMKIGTDPNYCARVTANDGKLGEQHLAAFQDNEKTIPTILTTSQKLSTGIDARNVRNIVLMRPVNSMIEFKQIIGRGTRLFDGKDYFTVYDFVKAYEHFSDPEWDGEPLDPEPPTPSPPGPGPDPDPDPVDPDPVLPPGERRLLKVTLADGKVRQFQHMVSTSFWGPDGTPLSTEQFLQQLFGDLPDFFSDEEQLREIWGHPETRRSLLEGLAEKGYSTAQLAEIRKLICAEQSDLFDVLAYIAFALSPLTREDRVVDRKDLIYSHYDDKQQAFIDFVLTQYIQIGVEALESDKLPSLLELKYNGIHDAIEELGEAGAIRELFVGFQPHLYDRGTTARNLLLAGGL
ncbi:MAG: type I restriction enzyme R subunit [Paracoccaceae bacterium]